MWDRYLADPLAPCRHRCWNQTRRKYLAGPTRNSLLSVYLKNLARSLSPQENNSWLLDTDFRSLFSNIMFFCHRFVILGFSFHLCFFCPSLFSPLPNLRRRDDTNRSLHYFDVMNSVARRRSLLRFWTRLIGTTKPDQQNGLVFQCSPPYAWIRALPKEDLFLMIRCRPLTLVIS